MRHSTFDGWDGWDRRFVAAELWQLLACIAAANLRQSPKSANKPLVTSKHTPRMHDHEGASQCLTITLMTLIGTCIGILFVVVRETLGLKT